MDRGETTDTYDYDENGNMTERVEGGVTWTQTFNAENRLESVSTDPDGVGGDPPEVWNFVYDGDGNRVKQVNPDGTISIFLGGGLYTIEDAATVTPIITKYYSIAGQRVAMNGPEGLQYLLTDHLGSIAAVLDAEGALVSEQRYMPFGAERLVPDIAQTDFGFTGQRDLAAVGLMDYNARWYDAGLGRFTQPDALVPSITNPQNLNRYSYVNNNSLNFIDPSGRKVCYDPENQVGCDGPILPAEAPDVLFSMYCYWGLVTNNCNFGPPLIQLDIDQGYEYLDPENPDHGAVDYNDPPNDKSIFASANGVVAFSSPCLASNNCAGFQGAEGDLYNSGYGHMIIIEYPWKSIQPISKQKLAKEFGLGPGDSIYALYAHLADPPALETGDIVSSGQNIGTVGNTGDSSGPHLHWDVEYGQSGQTGRWSGLVIFEMSPAVFGFPTRESDPIFYK